MKTRNKTFSSTDIEELFKIWKEIYRDGEWKVVRPIRLKWSWRKFDYVFYFIARETKKHTQNESNELYHRNNTNYPRQEEASKYRTYTRTRV